MSYVLTVPYTELTSLSPSHEIMYSPRLPTILESRNTRGKFSFPSVVDSGADYCVFPATFGEMLGIDVRSGESSQMAGFGGSGDCFYHSLNVVVVIEGLIYRFQCFAGFSYLMNELGIGLLGRHGFFELFEEVIFSQRERVFRLKVPGNKPSMSLKASMLSKPTKLSSPPRRRKRKS